MPTPRVTIDQLPEQAAPEDTNLLVIHDGDTTKKMTVATLKTIETAGLAAHIADPTGAHAATAISATDSGAGVNGVDVQAQLGQLAGRADTANAGLAAHIADTVDAHDASAISAVPHTGVSATHVQGQLEELATALAVKDVMWVGPDAPTDPVIEMWWDSNAESAYLPAPPSVDIGVIDSKAFNPVGDGVADDTAALQAFLNAEPTRAHFLRTPAVKYRTTATLTIPDAPGYHLYGESRWHTIIELDASNMAILQTAGVYQHNYMLENFCLRFKTNQPAANTNAVGLLFAGPAGQETQQYYSTYRNLQIDGTRVGIDQLRNPGFYQAVWNCVFDTIHFSNTSYSLIHIQSASGGGHPINTFRMLTSISAPGTGPALEFNAVEFSIDGLDIEDWAGRILLAYSGSGTIRGVHLERHQFPAASGTLFDLSDGAFSLEGYSLDFAAATTNDHNVVRLVGTTTRLRFGAGTIDHTRFTGANTFVLFRGAGQIDLAMQPFVFGNGTYYGAYFPWESAPSYLLTNHGSKTWDPASVATAAQTSTTLTVDGARLGDTVAVGFSVAVPAGVLLSGSVTANDTVTVTMLNQSGAPVDLASGTLRARVWKAF